MLNNCSYNKIKLIHDLSKVTWFMKHFCERDAKGCSKECTLLLSKIQKDLEKSIEILHRSLKK
jgi:hypothetical protein